MTGAERWRDNWRVISPPGTVRVDVDRSAAKRRERSQAVRGLAPGTPVALFASAPGATRRCRMFASEAGITSEQVFLTFPSASAPAYLVEDAPEAARFFVRSALVVPPKMRFVTVVGVGLAVLRALSPWRPLRWVAPGRVVLGRKA
jgi:hypothetical protein